MKLKPIARAAVFAAAFLAPSLVFADDFLGGPAIAGCDVYICWLGNLVLSIINLVLVPVLFAISFIVFLYGIAKSYIFSSGEPGEVAKGHKLILWGIIAFVVMISIWGLVNVVANTFGLAGFSAPPLPKSF
ncbi:MAG: hypothetical protein WC798_01280 [Candidatus Paceibacterota bacterium]|jgi:hypothetical protein